MHLYLQNAYFKGRVLTIVSNCSYSGFWVKEAMKFLDEHGVGPCGHTAKEKGILVKVYASCLANEIPAELAFSTRCAQNDKNTGTVQYNITLRGEEIHHGQHTSGLDFTEVQCKSKIDEPCTRAPGSTWQQWSTAQRVKKVRGKDKGRSAWHYVLLVDDEERIREYHDKVKEGSLDIADYGQILKSGWGQDPPKETKKWIEEQYFVNYMTTNHHQLNLSKLKVSTDTKAMYYKQTTHTCIQTHIAHNIVYVSSFFLYIPIYTMHNF